MKKASIILFAVCILLGTCILPVSAVTFAKDTYVEKIYLAGGLLTDNIKAIGSNEFNIPVTATGKADPELLGGTRRITEDNVDNLVRFKRGTAVISFQHDLAPYFDVVGTVVGTTANITFIAKSTNEKDVYRVLSTIDTQTDMDVSAKLERVSYAEKYLLSPETITVSGIRFITTLCTITTGPKLYTAGGVYDMDGIAVVEAHVQRQNGSISSYMFSKQNFISGVQPGETITLEASLTEPKDSEYYMFNGWVDGSGNLLSTSPAIMYTAEGKNASFFASYVQIKPHLSMNTDSLRLNYKQTAQLSAFPNAVRWESSNPKAVRVDSESGFIEAVGSGKATITAYSADGATATCEVTARYTFGQILILIFLFGFIWY